MDWSACKHNSGSSWRHAGREVFLIWDIFFETYVLSTTKEWSVWNILTGIYDVRSKELEGVHAIQFIQAAKYVIIKVYKRRKLFIMIQYCNVYIRSRACSNPGFYCLHQDFWCIWCCYYLLFVSSFPHAWAYRTERPIVRRLRGGESGTLSSAAYTPRMHIIFTCHCCYRRTLEAQVFAGMGGGIQSRISYVGHRIRI